MIINDMSYLEVASEVTDVKGSFGFYLPDFSLNTVYFNQETSTMNQMAMAGPGGIGSSLSSTKNKISTGSKSIISLS